MNGFFPNSTSATPIPSLPGSHEATSASICTPSSGGMIIGRPETTRTVHDSALEQTRRIASWSASLSSIVFFGPWDAVVAGVVGPLRAVDVAEPLGVRRLADHHDSGRVGRDRVARGLAELHPRPRRRPHRVEHGLAGDHVGRAALPGQRPAAGLVADVVGVAAGDVDRLLLARAERQGALPVLEQHLRLGHRPAGDLAVRLAADRVDVAAVGERVLEQPELELGRQDPRDRVVDPAHRHLAVLDQRGEGRDEDVPAIGVVRRLDRLHEHVDPGVDRQPHLLAVVARGSAGSPASRR